MKVPPVFTRACKKEKILCTCGVHVCLGYTHSTVVQVCYTQVCISVTQESENKFDVF